MKIIYKYSLMLSTGVQEFNIPLGAKILTVQYQQANPVMWVMVDTEMPDEKRTFELVETGKNLSELPNKYREYIGTFQMMDGAYVLHLFELKFSIQ